MTDYSDPYVNYQRLIETIEFLEKRNEVHPNFYGIHIKHIEMYNKVQDIDEEARIELECLIREYLLFEEFDLGLYLSACKKLVNTVKRTDVEDILQSLSIH